MRRQQAPLAILERRRTLRLAYQPLYASACAVRNAASVVTRNSVLRSKAHHLSQTPAAAALPVQACGS